MRELDVDAARQQAIDIGVKLPAPEYDYLRWMHRYRVRAQPYFTREQIAESRRWLREQGYNDDEVRRSGD